MATFPALSTGYLVQLPYTRGVRFRTRSAETPGGRRYTFATRQTGQRFWEIQYGALTGAEAAALRAFFEARGGRHESFWFTDPQTGSSHRVRFDQDEIVFRSVGPNEHSTTVRLVEVPA